jgi:hypothetical protein
MTQRITNPTRSIVRTLLPASLFVGVACSGGTAETFEKTQVELSRTVGEPCLLGEEEDPTFPGLSSDEVVVASDVESCDYGSCVAYHFQGRVSCPDGQVSEGECSTPSGEPVTVPVEAQLANRPADTHVFCSCRCDGLGDGPFCECPSDHECRELVPPLFGETEISGSYCVPRELPEYE